MAWLTTGCQMSDRPILFSDAMVTAILAEKKTQTRRLVHQPALASSTAFDDAMQQAAKRGLAGVQKRGPEDGIEWRVSPRYGVAGDQLWVRECWNVGRFCGGEGPRTWFEPTWEIPKEKPDDCEIIYREAGFPGMADVPVYRPGIHMPRWASRLTLDVTAVRIERLHTISEYDAYAEGVKDRAAYALLWDAIHRPKCRDEEIRNREFRGTSWSSNPWVWVVEFSRAA